MIKLSAHIKHEGIIHEVREKELVVKIALDSGCAACSTKDACYSSCANEKYVEVLKPAGTFSVNDRVIISIKKTKVMKAVFLGYIVPFLILITMILVLSTFGFNEVIVAVGSLFLMCAYYGFLFFFRNLMAKEFQFYIKI